KRSVTGSSTTPIVFCSEWNLYCTGYAAHYVSRSHRSNSITRWAARNLDLDGSLRASRRHSRVSGVRGRRKCFRAGRARRSRLLRHLRIPDHTPAIGGARSPAAHQPRTLLPAADAPDFSAVLRADLHPGDLADGGMAAACAVRRIACADVHVELLPGTIVVHRTHVVAIG